MISPRFFGVIVLLSGNVVNPIFCITLIIFVIVIHNFLNGIFNFSIQFIWLNATYIIINLYCTVLQIYSDIGKTLCYHKLSLIWIFIFYAVLLFRMKLSPTLQQQSTLYLFSQILSLLICSCFCWRINSQSTLYFIGIIISRPNTNYPGL